MPATQKNIGYSGQEAVTLLLLPILSRLTGENSMSIPASDLLSEGGYALASASAGDFNFNKPIVYRFFPIPYGKIVP